MNIPLSQNILKQISPSADETFTVCAREESANRILKHNFDERIDVQLLWEILRRENIDKKNQVNYLGWALYTKQSFKNKKYLMVKKSYSSLITFPWLWITFTLAFPTRRFNYSELK